MSTKFDSLAAVLAQGINVSQGHRVLNFLTEFGPHTRDDIATCLDLRVSSVCARVNELVKAGTVNQHCTKWNATTKRRVAVYKVT